MSSFQVGFKIDFFFFNKNDFLLTPLIYELAIVGKSWARLQTKSNSVTTVDSKILESYFH